MGDNADHRYGANNPHRVAYFGQQIMLSAVNSEIGRYKTLEIVEKEDESSSALASCSQNVGGSRRTATDSQEVDTAGVFHNPVADWQSTEHIRCYEQQNRVHERRPKDSLRS